MPGPGAGPGATGFGGGGGTGGFDAGFGGGSGATCALADPGPLVEPARAPPAISGGTMAVLTDGSLAIADSDRDLVYLVAPTLSFNTVALTPGDEPGRVVEGPAGSVFVALRSANAVAQVDVGTHTVSQRFAACAAPRGLAWDGTASTLYVACSSGELARLDFSAGTPGAAVVTHPVDDLRDVMHQGGQLLVTTLRDPAVWSISPDGSATPYARPAPAIDPNGIRQFAPRVAWRTIATSAGLVMSYQQEETTPLPFSQPCVSSGYGTGGEPFGGDGGVNQGTVSAGLVRLQASSASELTNPFVTGVLPVDVAASTTSDGQRIAVAYAGSMEIGLIMPGLPGEVLSPNGEPVAVAFRGDHLFAFVREPATLVDFSLTAGVGTTSQSTTTLDTVSVASTGHELFHRSTANVIACASCHPEAGEDGHVWQLQEGTRRTPSLRGGLTGTEPFHWSGEEANFDTLMNDIFTVRMGGFAEPPDHTAALTRWLDAQPKRAPPGDLDVSAVARGETAFHSLGCDSCHSGATGTNNASVDVGTGEIFQVPRLVELAYRAPFLHDGTVPTLADRFTVLGGAAHAGSSGLSAQQISDLVAYLKTR